VQWSSVDEEFNLTQDIVQLFKCQQRFSECLFSDVLTVRTNRSKNPPHHGEAGNINCWMKPLWERNLLTFTALNILKSSWIIVDGIPLLDANLWKPRINASFFMSGQSSRWMAQHTLKAECRPFECPFYPCLLRTMDRQNRVPYVENYVQNLNESPVSLGLVVELKLSFGIFYT